MTKLVTGAEFSEFRNAINDVIDTFHNFIVTHCKAEQEFDRWGEENEPSTTIKTDLRCLVEFMTESEDKETKRTEEGAEDIQNLEVSFGIDYLESVGMMDPVTKEAAFDRAKDYFIYESVVYRLIGMVADGPIDTKNALIVITLKKEEKDAT